MIIRAMQEGETEAVAAMVRRLATDIGVAVVPQLTGEGLRQAGDLIDVVVAEQDGVLAGACLGLMTFSTWRGTRGLYIVDLFVDGRLRGQQVGLRLLRETARRAVAKGAAFIKLEVDMDNAGAARFYERIGFVMKDEDRLFVLEQDRLRALIAVGED